MSRSNIPDVEFVRPCNLCPHMKRITLPKILDSLSDMTRRGDHRSDDRRPARRAVERMIDLQS